MRRVSVVAGSLHDGDNSRAVDIHAPHRSISSLKEGLVHLTLITLGVLIALSFEGIASWREHRALVREARANLASEIHDNIEASLLADEQIGGALLKDYERVLQER
jgi:hypothetical protein